MKDIFRSLLIAISTLAFAAAIVFVGAVVDKGYTGYLATLNQENKNQAIQDCYIAARYEYIDAQNVKINQPVVATYKACVEDKGYSTSLK